MSEEKIEYKVSVPLFEKGELETFDNHIHEIVEKYSKLVLKEKEQILTQRIIIKQEEELKEKYKQIEILCNDIEEQGKEIERLNNIINEFDKWLGESIEKHTEDYLDWKYDRNVYLAGSKKLQNVLDKLQELKGVDKE